MKNIIIGLLLILAVGAGAYFYFNKSSNTTETTNIAVENTGSSTTTQNTASSTEQMNNENSGQGQTIIGTSVDGNNITAFTYGTGTTDILFVGGIHGGYEWNTVLTMYQLMDYLGQNPSAVPSNLKVSVIPVLNPDGLQKTVGTTGRFTVADVPASEAAQIAGRFNANNVDLNRNFDCDWQTEGVWKTKKVSGGTAAFSEPESKALKSYVETIKPEAVIVYYSSAGGVYASSCHNGVSNDTQTLTKVFADASGYKGYQDFNFYEITGDAVNWLAKQNIPAISVLLTNHTDTEWNKNLPGIKAVLNFYAK